MNDIFTTILILLEWALILLAYIILTRETVEDAIFWYRVQCLTLAYATTTTAVIRSTDKNYLLFALIVILPLGLFFVIRPVLMNATFYDPSLPFWSKLKAIFSPSEQFQHKVVRIWKNVGSTVPANRRALTVFAAFLGVTILITYRLVSLQTSTLIAQEELIEANGLIASLCLHLIGLYNMIVKRDIISQVIGLLIMDHGLYLAIVKVVAIPVPAFLFVIALYFYTLITVSILLLMLPNLSDAAHTIDLDLIAKSSELTEVNPSHVRTKEQSNGEF